MRGKLVLIGVVLAASLASAVQVVMRPVFHVRTSVPTSPAITNANLVARYRFDNDGWLDTVSGSNALNRGGPQTQTTFSAFSKVGPAAAYFTWQQTNYLSTVNPTLLNGATEITVAAWVNIKSYKYDLGGVVSATSANGSGSNAVGFSERQTSPAIRMSVNITNGSSGAFAVVPTNTWVWLCGTFRCSEGVSRIYTNGIYVAQGTTNKISTIYQDNPFWIGNRYAPSLGSQFFDGWIDDVLIFNAALSSNAINSMYTGPYKSGGGP